MNIAEADPSPASSEALFHSSPSPMWVGRPANGRFLAVNAAAIRQLGYSEAEFREMTLSAICPEADEWEKPVLPEPATAPGTRVLTTRLRRKDGEFRHVELHANPLEYRGESADIVSVIDLTAREQMEADLRARETQLRDLFEHAWVGLAQVSLEGRCMRANQALLRLLGKNNHDLQGHAMVECFHHDDQPTDPAWMTPLLEGAVGQLQFEKRLMRSDQTPVWARITLSRLPSVDGHPGLMMALVEDLTAQRQASAALAASEARYREIVESASEGVWQFDAAFRTTFVNRRMAEILGTTREAMIGTRWEDYLNAAAASGLAEFADRCRAGRRGALDCHLLAPDGREVWALFSTSPRMDTDGRFQGAVALVTDITERKRMEKALQISEARFREIAETIEEVFWVADVSIAKSLYVSPAYERVWGRTCESLRTDPRSFLDAIHPNDRELVKSKLVYQRLGEPFALEYRVIRPDGSLRWVYDRGYPVRDASGCVTHFVGSCSDITERRLLEIAARQRREHLEAIASDEPLEKILNQLLQGLTQYWPGTQMGLFQAEEGAGCATISAVAPEDATWGGPMSAALDPLSREAWKETSGDTLLGPADFARWPAGLARMGRDLGVTWAMVQYFATKPATAFWLLVWGTSAAPAAAELTARIQGKVQLLRLAITRRQTLSDLQQLAASLERRVTEQTEQVRRQADAMDATVEGLAVLEGNTYVYMNPAHAKMYGYAVDELIGKPWTLLYDPEETRRLQEEAFPILAAQRYWSGETQGRRKDGSRITGDISLTLTPQGYLVCACRDNTLRHQQTEAIRRSQEQLSLVLNSTNDGFWDWSIAHGTVTYSARYLEMLGYRLGELPNTPETWSERLHPDERTQVLAESAALRSGTAATFNREYRLRTKSDQWLWVHDRGKVVAYDEVGRPVRAVGTLSDITQRREAESALRQRTAELIELNAELARAAQGRDEFLARVSHELRTPLTSILALTEMLADPPMTAVDERALRQIRSIHDSGLHLLQLINEILDLAKLEAGRFQLKIAPCDAAEIARASLRLVSPQATRRELELTFEPGPSDLHVLADPLRLKQMLVNLLGNAIKFTPAHGRIQLEISQPEPGRVQFRVNDTGIGISPDKLGKLFRPFMQLESGLNQSTGGSGLGLVIVKHFAELQQGSISVTSAPGYGSCFYLQLPEATPSPVPALPLPEASAPAAPVDPAPTEPPDRSQPSDPLTVLLVDDNELNRESLAEFLTRAGFKVVPVPDGASALRELLQVRPDVIIMDVQMPGMDGLEVTRRLRQLPDPGIAGTPVLGLTAMAMPDDRERCLRAGMTAYQKKPFPLKSLPEALKRLARSRPTRP